MFGLDYTEVYTFLYVRMGIFISENKNFQTSHFSKTYVYIAQIIRMKKLILTGLWVLFVFRSEKGKGSGFFNTRSLLDFFYALSEYSDCTVVRKEGVIWGGIEWLWACRFGCVFGAVGRSGIKGMEAEVAPFVQTQAGGG
ncbi:hypothetical protein FUAX_13920 [Fulvitalea axinellae]|uniref:Uncharacterized protein n=1 Tax=Fulvitalea axinellae TaxID=1182444 RepID=A0AAU9CI71_9BACT|nr:hypothetical protein FUAX_13920 [Fulvitalea axinellae]